MMEIERPKIDTASLSADGRYGKFVVEPLERGFGTTLGNSLRRVLLSSLPRLVHVAANFFHFGQGRAGHYEREGLRSLLLVDGLVAEGQAVTVH